MVVAAHRMLKRPPVPPEYYVRISIYGLTMSVKRILCGSD